MRELHIKETTQITGGISNLGMVLSSGLLVGALSTLSGASLGYSSLGLVAMGTVGFMAGTGIGLSVVCAAAVVKFAGEDFSFS